MTKTTEIVGIGRTCKHGHVIEGDNVVYYQKWGKTQTACRQCKRESSKNHRKTKGRWLPKETKAVMAAFKEPLKPVPQGYGYYGTLSYDESHEFTQCHLCGNFYQLLGTHVSKIHGLSSKDYKLQMGLPGKLSLSAPRANNGNHQYWMGLSPEERAKKIADLKRNHENNPGARRGNVSLYRKNLQGRCPDQLLDKIMTLKEKLGRTPSRREFQKEHDGKFIGSIDLTFGNWGEALKILNLVPKQGGRSIYESYDRETLLTMLFDFRTRYGREPMSSDCERGLLPHRYAFRKHFGSFTEAKKYVMTGNEGVTTND